MVNPANKGDKLERINHSFSAEKKAYAKQSLQALHRRIVQTDKDPEEAVNTISIEDDEENADLDEFDRLLNKKQVNKYSKTPNEQTLNHL